MAAAEEVQETILKGQVSFLATKYRNLRMVMIPCSDPGYIIERTMLVSLQMKTYI